MEKIILNKFAIDTNLMLETYKSKTSGIRETIKQPPKDFIVEEIKSEKINYFKYTLIK